MTDAILLIVLAVVVLAILIVIFARLYVRTTREVSLVRTGFGGRKVVMDGGTLAIPYFHEISRVNMQTLRLEVSRTGEAALITQDRMRVDVAAAFYVSVVPTAEGIARAAQTLGSRTFHPDKLRELIEGKLVDALRSVAARVTMDDLHENRSGFVAAIRENLGESLARNGLELDSVSLTTLDQTPFRALDENNAFNAVGMRKLAEIIARSRKERAEIDADADVAVRRAAMEAARRKLQIDLEEQEATIAQVQQIETLKAAQMAEVVRRKADGEREAALARIAMEQTIRAAEIARARDEELAEQQRQIALAESSQAESKARAAADAARATAVRDAEAVETARQVAEAERHKEVGLIRAQQDAETTRVRAEARKTEGLAEAEAQRALVDAENAMDPNLRAMKVDLARLETLPKVVSEMVKPAEKIESIRIHNISGLGGGSTGGGERPPVRQALDSILEMAVQLPALRKIGEDLGVSLGEALDRAETGNAEGTSGEDTEDGDTGR